MAKSHPLPPPSMRNRGGEGEPLRRPIPAVRGSVAARNRGEMERRRRWFDSPTLLGLGWSEAAGPQGPAAVGGDACGGGVARPGKGLGVAVELMGEVSCAGVLLIGLERRWRGSEAVVAAGEWRGCH